MSEIVLYQTGKNINDWRIILRTKQSFANSGEIKEYIIQRAEGYVSMDHSYHGINWKDMENEDIADSYKISLDFLKTMLSELLPEIE